MDALFGKARHFEVRGLYKEALETLHLLVVNLPNFTPPLIEIIKVNLAEQEWDLSLDSSNR